MNLEMKKYNFSFRTTPLGIDTPLHNHSAFPGISKSVLQTELTDWLDKKIWVPDFKSFWCDLEEIGWNRSIILKAYEWRDLDYLSKQDMN